MFEKLRASIGARAFVKQPLDNQGIDLFTAELLAFDPEVQQQIARLLLKRVRDQEFSLKFAAFPWAHAKIEDQVFVEYWRTRLDIGHIGEYSFEYSLKLLKSKLPHLPRDIGVRLIDDAIAVISTHRHPECFSKTLQILQQLKHGSRAVLEPWQESFFQNQPLAALVDHALEFKGAQPGQKWLKKASKLAETASAEAYRAEVHTMLKAIQTMDKAVSSVVSDQVRGLLVFLSFWPGPDLAHDLRRALEVTADKIPGTGARCVKGFSGALWVLEQMGSFDALAAMGLAKARIKTPQLVTQIEVALAYAAALQHITLEELEERIVPDYGLNFDGISTVQMGTDRAELRLDDLARAELLWFSGSKKVASPTAAMKGGFADEIATLKRQKKELESMVSAQKRRLDRSFLSRRRIPFGQWKENYLDHPVVARLSRRLIWDFRTGEESSRGIPTVEGLESFDGSMIVVDPETTTVRLWHPIDSDESLAWRDHLFRNEITQPFKQAFREVYVLTPAEETTRLYSNRFAAQIVRQHQAVALMRDRGWKAQLHGGYDAEFSNPRRTLTDWGLTAEFFVEMAGDEVLESGIGIYLATDQVRFLNALGAVPLLDVPALVFSEVCRDIDLFVGVASIGNDPEWVDQGTREIVNRERWESLTFGELSQVSETRKDVLARLLPRLKIGHASEIDGKFLVVRGKLHTYKIHLGSGNILFGANNRYLCIVPGGKDSTSAVFLPFEGDRTLSIILSKAALLAEDVKITDSTIVRQIR